MRQHLPAVARYGRQVSGNGGQVERSARPGATFPGNSAVHASQVWAREKSYRIVNIEI